MLIVSSFVVILLGILLASPQPDLKWEEDILPLARQYATKNGGSTGYPLDGVKVVITGATNGIGLGLVKRFTSMGATVIALGRSPTKLQALQNQIGNTGNKLVTVQVQLEDLESVQKASNEISSQFDSIDMLINNAGIHYSSGNHHHKNGASPTTAQGIDLSYGINYLSHFLLTERFLPLLQNSTHHPAVIQISSTFHFGADGSELVVDDDKNNDNDNNQEPLPLVAAPGGLKGFYSDQRAYANSKLAQLLHARALQRRYPNIRFKSICPCWVGTGIAGRNVYGFFLGRIAFPHDSFGIKSALVAALDIKAGNDQDYFSNSHWTQAPNVLMPKLFYAPWVYRHTPVRDAIVQGFAGLLLPMQKFVASVQARQSSPESYNETLQEALYQWSYQTVREYLVE
eukprot:Sro901_g218030.1 daunorubicin C-13 ketoreductase DnrU (400) ;mRNA; r:27120-28319